MSEGLEGGCTEGDLARVCSLVPKLRDGAQGCACFWLEVRWARSRSRRRNPASVFWPCADEQRRRQRREHCAEAIGQILFLACADQSERRGDREKIWAPALHERQMVDAQVRGVCSLLFSHVTQSLRHERLRYAKPWVTPRRLPALEPAAPAGITLEQVVEHWAKQIWRSGARFSWRRHR